MTKRSMYMPEIRSLHCFSPRVAVFPCPGIREPVESGVLRREVVFEAFIADARQASLPCLHFDAVWPSPIEKSTLARLLRKCLHTFIYGGT